MDSSIEELINPTDMLPYFSVPVPSNSVFIPLSFVGMHVMLLTFHFHDECFLFLVIEQILCVCVLLDSREKWRNFYKFTAKVPYLKLPLDIGRQKTWKVKKRCANVFIYALLNNLWSIAKYRPMTDNTEKKI